MKRLEIVLRQKSVQVIVSSALGGGVSLCLYFALFFERPKAIKLILFSGLLLAISIISHYLLFRLTPTYFQHFKKRKIILLAVLTLAASAIMSFLFVTSEPSLIHTRHTFELIPTGQKNEQSSSADVVLFEIRDENNEIIPFEKLDPNNTWESREYDGLNARIASDDKSDPILYRFYGSQNDSIQVLFKATANSGIALVRLDSHEKLVDLFDRDEGDTIQSLQVDYRIREKAGLFLVYFVGFLFMVLCFWGLWISIEKNTYNRLSNSVRNFLTFMSKIYDRPVWLLGVLFILSLAFHAISILATPLKVYPDSGGYINAAISIAKYHDWGSILVAFRGPGWALLFSPFLIIFGENPWPVKIFLHLLGIGQVFLAYGVGKIITQKNWFAFICGLLVLLVPDIIASGNVVLSESVVPFFVLLFVFIALKYLQTGKIYLIYFCFLVVLAAGSLRIENIALAFLFLITVGIQLGLERDTHQGIKVKRSVLHLTIGLGLVILPMALWSNFQEKPTRELASAYRAAVVYSGWVHFGEIVGVSILDHNSPAVQVIQDAHERSRDSYLEGAQPFLGNTWSDYSNMISIGMTPEEIAQIFYEATIDSILADPGKALRLAPKKFNITFRFASGLGYWATQTLAGEEPSDQTSYLIRRYFSVERIYFPKIIKLQRTLSNFFKDQQQIYTSWLWFCLIGTLICFFRKPFYQGVLLGGVIFLQIVWPPIICAGEPRFLLRGLGVFMVTGVVALDFIITWLFQLYETKFHLTKTSRTR